MIENLDEIRKQHLTEMKTAVQVMEEQRFIRTKLLSLRFLNGRTAFTVTRGFKHMVMVAQLLIFMDGILLHARKEVMVSKEVTFNINMRYSNLPLKDGKKIAVIIHDISQSYDALDDNNLYMTNNEEGYLLPVTVETYKVI